MNNLVRRVRAVAGVVAFGAALAAWGAEPVAKPCCCQTGVTSACFMKDDANKDGKVSKDEFGKRHEATFKKIDKNGDGKITKDEFLAGRADIYTAIDANGDEAVVVDELAAYYIHPDCKPGDCKDLPKPKNTRVHFDSLDVNGDGAIVIEEHVAYCAGWAAAMDTDKNGKLTKAEFTTDADGRFTAKDANKDGVVTIEEYTLYLVTPAKAPEAAK